MVIGEIGFVAKAVCKVVQMSGREESRYECGYGNKVYVGRRTWEGLIYPIPFV